MRRRVLPLLVAGALALSTVLFAAPVQAADTGTIEGKVNLPVGHTWDPDWYGYGGVTAFLVDGTSLDWAGYGEIQSDGTYTVTDLLVDEQYVVCVDRYVNVDPRDLMTTCYGGFTTLHGNPEVLDVAMTPVVVPAVPGTVTNVNIDMVAAAKISGTVYLPNSTHYPGSFEHLNNVRLFEVDGDGTLNWGEIASINADGSYSLLAVPGASYAIMANTYDYPATWLGGRAGEEPTLPDPLVTVVTAPAPGQTLSGQDITLAQGFSISGTVNDFDPGAFGSVTACALGADGTQIDCKWVDITGPGAYQIDGLIPGVPFVVSAWVAPGYSATYYGGAYGPVGLPNDDVTEIVHPTPGGMVSGVDINMVKLMTITGSVAPASMWDDVTVVICPVFSEDGQNYYRDWAAGSGIAPLGITATALEPVSNGPSDVNQVCTYGWFDSDTGLFSVKVDAGRDYVVIGVAAGYTDVWYGGYVGDSGVLGWGVGSTALPDSPLITLVSGAPGQTISNVDLVFGPVGPVTVTIVIDGVDTVITVAPDGTVVLPTPAKAGFTFVGWFTDLNDPGSQFSAATPVTSDLTLYAKWAPTSVTPAGAVSSVTAVAVSGTGDPGSVVTVTFPNGATRTVTVGAAGTWSVPTPVGVSSGKVVVVITDPVTGATSTMTLDFKAPVAVLTGGAVAYPVGGLLVLIASGLSIVAGVALMRRSLLT